MDEVSFLAHSVFRKLGEECLALNSISLDSDNEFNNVSKASVLKKLRSLKNPTQDILGK